MRRILSALPALAICLTLAPAALTLQAVFAPQAAFAAPSHTSPPHKKHHVSRHWHGYGFLPGYRSPEQIQAARDWHYWESGPHYYGPAWPRFYRGRWNGGGFGPCYTQTPIGPMWNCGR